EHFTLPVATAHFADGKGFMRITAVVPDADEKVWFVAEEDELPHFPVYETTPAIAQAVIGECYAFESYLVSKDLRWLLCENHHDALMAIGAVHDRLIAGRGGVDRRRSPPCSRPLGASTTRRRRSARSWRRRPPRSCRRPTRSRGRSRCARS